jgi:hypothetical protein
MMLIKQVEFHHNEMTFCFHAATPSVSSVCIPRRCPLNIVTLIKFVSLRVHKNITANPTESFGVALGASWGNAVVEFQNVSEVRVIHFVRQGT